MYTVLETVSGNNDAVNSMHVLIQVIKGALLIDKSIQLLATQNWFTLLQPVSVQRNAQCWIK